MNVVWAPLAEKRAREAVNYIASENPGAAADWLDELLERVGALDPDEVPDIAGSRD